MNPDLNLKNQYLHQRFIYSEIFSPQECELIILNTKKLSETSRDIAPAYAKAKIIYIKRSEDSEWIYQRINNLIEAVNNQYYKFRINSLENIKFMEYQENDYFDWHIDICGKDPINWCRKINTVTFLSDHNDYQGGQIIFNQNGGKENPDIRQEQGSILLFPSFQPHKVCPVKKGKRYALSLIAQGDSFQ